MSHSLDMMGGSLLALSLSLLYDLINLLLCLYALSLFPIVCPLSFPFLPHCPRFLPPPIQSCCALASLFLPPFLLTQTLLLVVDVPPTIPAHPEFAKTHTPPPPISYLYASPHTSVHLSFCVSLLSSLLSPSLTHTPEGREEGAPLLFPIDSAHLTGQSPL